MPNQQQLKQIVDAQVEKLHTYIEQQLGEPLDLDIQTGKKEDLVRLMSEVIGPLVGQLIRDDPN